MKNLDELNEYRVAHPLWPQSEHDGVFRIPLGGQTVTVWASTDDDGEHVSMDLSKLETFPSEEEARSIVERFFSPDEEGIQLHYSRVHKPTWSLHIFRPVPNITADTLTRTAANRYQVELYYGFENGENGVYHAIEAVDPDACVDDDTMKASLLEALELEPDCPYFNYDSMYVALPDSVVERIKADAVREYLAQQEKAGAKT